MRELFDELFPKSSDKIELIIAISVILAVVLLVVCQLGFFISAIALIVQAIVKLTGG